MSLDTRDERVLEACLQLNHDAAFCSARAFRWYIKSVQSIRDFERLTHRSIKSVERVLAELYYVLEHSARRIRHL